MSEPIKLKNAGDKHTMDVASCAKLAFGDYPEYEFVGRDGSKVRVPEVSAKRQLERLELTADSIVGRRVTIKRDPNSKNAAKPFWGLYLEDGAKSNGSGAANAATPGSPTSGAVSQPPHSSPAPTQASDEKEKLNKVYGRCLDHVLAVEVPKLKAAGVTVTHEGVSAMTSTLFIAARDR